MPRVLKHCQSGKILPNLVTHTSCETSNVYFNVPIPASFYFRPFLITISIIQIEKAWIGWSALDLNPQLQDGGLRRNHGAMTGAILKVSMCAKMNV